MTFAAAAVFRKHVQPHLYNCHGETWRGTVPGWASPLHPVQSLGAFQCRATASQHECMTQHGHSGKAIKLSFNLQTQCSISRGASPPEPERGAKGHKYAKDTACLGSLRCCSKPIDHNPDECNRCLIHRSSWCSCKDSSRFQPPAAASPLLPRGLRRTPL